MQVTRIHVQVTHSGRLCSLALDRSTPVSSFLATLETEFSVLASTAKLLAKGKKLDLSSEESTIETVFANSRLDSTSTTPEKPLKLLLIGPRSDALQSLKETEALREKKKKAFQHHQSISQFSKPLSTSRIHGLGQEDVGNYKFWELEPFPKSVPVYEKRLAMLKRLASDEAVVDVMKRHRFAVGVL
jgi:hypothetical protein